MSYCRMNGVDSDIYLYHDIYQGLMCMSCPMLGDCGGHAVFPWAKDAIVHCKRHQALGHKVPARAFTELKKEAKKQAIKQEADMKEFKKIVKKIDAQKKARMKKEKPFWDKIWKKAKEAPINQGTK